MKRFQERGMSIPIVLFILTILTAFAVTFMYTVQFQAQQAGYQQAKITAGYVAEIGFNQMRSKLAKYNGDWKQIPGIVKDCEPVDPFRNRCQYLPESNSFATFVKVRENPIDANSAIMGIYEARIETGQKRDVFGNQTVTGSQVGYIPGTVLSNEKKGYDRFGNQLCDMGTDGCPGKYMGIQVTAWLTKSNGELLPKTNSQSVYGVIEIGSSTNEGCSCRLSTGFR